MKSPLGGARPVEEGGDTSAERLIEMAFGPESADRARILRSLHTRGDPAQRCLAVALTLSSDWDVRDEAVQALGRVGTDADIEYVEPRLRDRHWVVRASAADALADIGAVAGFQLLRDRYLRERHADVRRYIATALARGPADMAQPALLEWEARESQGEALVGVLYGLVGLGRGGAFTRLLHLADGTGTHVTALALTAIRELLKEGVLTPEQTERAVGAYQLLVSHPVRRVSSTAEEGLAEYLSRQANADRSSAAGNRRGR